MSRSMIRDQVEVLSIAEGFFQSSILFVLLDLRAFDRIGDGERSAADLADELGCDPEAIGRLLRAGVVIEVLESTDGESFRIAPSCRRVLLPSAGSNYLGDWIHNLAYFRDALAHLGEVVLSSKPSIEFADSENSAEHAAEFTMAMHNYASLRGKELARFLDTTGCRSLLDLGAGPGTYAFQLGETNPELELFLIDVAPVLEVAKEVEAFYQLTKPVTYLPLDVNTEEIPGSYDLVLVSNTLHMLGEANSRALLRRLYDHVNPGGSLVIQAQFLRENRMGDRWPVLLDLVQLCITSEGRNHTVAETRTWLEEAGFSDVEHCAMTLLNTNSFLRAWKR